MNTKECAEVVDDIYFSILALQNQELSDDVKLIIYRTVHVAFNVGRAYEHTDPKKSMLERYRDATSICVMTEFDNMN